MFLKISLTALILGFLLTSFFWLPALGEQKFVTLNAFNRRDFYQNHFVFLRQLIYSAWQYGFSVAGPKDTMSFQIGIIHLFTFSFLILEVIFLFLKRSFYFKKEKRNFLLAGVGLFLLSVFLMLPVSNFIWHLIPLLGYLQFPWRFLSLSIFSLAVLAAILADNHKILGIILTILVFASAQQFTKPFLWDKKSNMFYYDFLFTTTVRHENNPIWFNEENINKFKPKFLSDSGLVKFNELSWKTGKHIYEVDAPASTNIWEHTVYFPGWQAFIDGQKTKILYNNKDYKGLIGLKIPGGRHKIIIRFQENTPVRIIGDCLSLLTFLLILATLKYLAINEKKS